MSKRVLVALCTATGLLAPAGLAAVAPVTAYAATNTVLHVGARGSEVAQLQRRLNTLGFHAGTVDGVFGSTTATAVRAFQRSRHLVPDGIVGQATWSALGNAGSASGSTKDRAPASTLSSRGGSLTSIPRFPGRLIQFGRRGTDVKEVQTQLNHLGYHCGTADGVYGSQTFAAIRAFQRAHHLTQDGVVGQSTWPILFGAKSSPPPKPTPPSSRGGSPQPVAYAVYDYFGNKLGSSASLSAAEGLAKQHPASVVKDVTGKVLYYQTGYVAYQDPAHVLGVYPYYGTAKSAAGNSGFVVNDYHKVDWLPTNYYYLNGGSWTSRLYGVQGSQTPPSNVIAPGIRYLPVSVNPGHSPFNTKFYPFEAADGTYIGSASNSFMWENQYRTDNLKLQSNQTPGSLDAFLAGHPLAGLGYSYVDSEKYGANAVYLMAHSILESAWGSSSIAMSKNNVFGYGAYDSSPGNDAGSFPSDDYAIHFQSWLVTNSYLDNGNNLGLRNLYTSLGPNLDGMSLGGYATDPAWSASIAGIINNYADHPGNSFSPSGAPVINPAPNYTSEPIYVVTGFNARIPAYPGSDVQPNPNVATDQAKTVQDALNAAGYGPLTVDGEYGSQTQGAVTKFQKDHSLPQTGTVDVNTWNALFGLSGLTPGTPFHVDQVEMSFLHNLTLETVHDADASKMVWEPYLHFTNVYRIEPVNDASQVTVYKSDGSVLTDSQGLQVYLHMGDYVESDTGLADTQTGTIAVSFSQWRNGVDVTFPGYVKVSDVRMQVDHDGQTRLPTYNGLDPANE